MNDANFERNLTGRGDDDRPAAGRDRGDSGDDRRTPSSGANGPPALRRLPPERYRHRPADGHGLVVHGGVPDEAPLDLRKYLFLALKHRWLILGSVAVFACLGLLVTVLTTPLYRATVTLQINRDAERVVDVEGLQPINGGIEFYQTQYELLRSRSLAERVVETLALQDDPAFMAAERVSPWAYLRNLAFGGGSAATTEDVGARQQAAASKLLAGLQVEPVRGSTIVKASFDSTDPALAKKVADAVAENFIQTNLDRRYQASAYARNFLEERLRQLKLKLEESEKELVAYAEAQQIVEAGDGEAASTTNLAGANDALAKATTDRLQKELVWQQAESTEGLALPKFLENGAIADMRARGSALEAEYQDKLSLFKPAYPEMRKLSAQIDELDRQIAAEIALIKQSVKAEYDAAVANQASLAEHVEELEAEVTDFRNRNIQYNILQREVDTNRSLYDGLLQRYKEIGVAGGVGTNNISIVDQAQIPGSPFKPSLKRNLVLATVLGLLFGCGAALVREHFSDTFKSPEDLEEDLGLPLLGIIPLVESGDPTGPLANTRSAISEAYRSLRTALQFSTTEGVPKTLLVTSSRAAEGKSTTALTLARNFSELGNRVLLIDCDLREPSLHDHLGCDNTVGLTDYLAGGVMPPDVFQRTDHDDLTFLPAGPLPPNPAELLAGPRMLTLLTVTAQQFDVVVVDGPPVGGLADAPLLASISEGTLMVVDAGATRRGIVKAALKRLDFARALVIGVAATKLDLRDAAYAYGYGHAYGYGSTGYYGGEAAARLTKRG